jgi:hypothetical protein
MGKSINFDLRFIISLWMLNEAGNQLFEAAQMKFLRPLLRFTKLDHERNSNIRKDRMLKI